MVYTKPRKDNYLFNTHAAILQLVAPEILVQIVQMSSLVSCGHLMNEIINLVMQTKAYNCSIYIFIFLASPNRVVKIIPALTIRKCLLNNLTA